MNRTTEPQDMREHRRTSRENITTGNKFTKTDSQSSGMGQGRMGTGGLRDEKMGRSGMVGRTVRRSTSEADYEANLTKMYAQQLENYDKFTKPLVDDLSKDSTSTEVIDRARENAGKLGAKATEMTNRQQSYTMSTLLPSQRAAQKASIGLGAARGQTAAITQGHMQQQSDRQAARVQLMQISEQLQSTGSASMSQAVSQKNQRDAAYKAAKGGFMSQIGAIAGGAIGFMAGGPAGAAAGAGIGSGVGSAVGG
jgi:hypothetical protein